MGKRSQSRTTWAKRHDQPTYHTNRVWICVDCKTRFGLIGCTDGLQRCVTCKTAFDRQASLPIVSPGQLVQPPRVG
jgi:hypothetical protein